MYHSPFFSQNLFKFHEFEILYNLVFTQFWINSYFFFSINFLYFHPQFNGVQRALKKLTNEKKFFNLDRMCRADDVGGILQDHR